MKRSNKDNIFVFDIIPTLMLMLRHAVLDGLYVESLHRKLVVWIKQPWLKNSTERLQPNPEL